MNERARKMIENLRADRELIRAAAEAVRGGPVARWAGLDEQDVAERAASILDLAAEYLERMPAPDRAHWVRVAADLTGRRMDRPSVRRTRRR